MDSTLNPRTALFEPASGTSTDASSPKFPFSFDPEVAVFISTPSTKPGSTSLKLDPEAISFKPSFKLNPEAAPLKAPFQLNPEAATFKAPSRLNPKAASSKLPFQFNPEATPFKGPFQFNPEASSFKHLWQLNPEAAPFKPPFQLNPEANVFKPLSQLNPKAAYFLPLALKPWEEQLQWFRWLQWALRHKMTHVAWSVASREVAALSVTPGAEVHTIPDVVGMFNIDLYPRGKDTLPHVFHPQGPHHYNWLSKPVYQKSFTKPATSLAIIQGPPKLQIMPVAHLEPRDLHQQLLLRRGFQYIDPVVFVGDREILQLSGTALENAATGLTEKFYAWGWWRGDYYDEYDDVPQLDPLNEVSYNPEDVVANGMYEDHDVRLPEHWTEAQRRAAQKTREEGEGRYKFEAEYQVGKSSLRKVWNASDMDGFEIPLSNWADEADEFPCLTLENVNDTMQRIRKDLNIAALTSSEETDSPTDDEGESSTPILPAAFPATFETSLVGVDDIETPAYEKTQENSVFVGPGSEKSTDSSSPLSSIVAKVQRSVSTSLTLDEDSSVDLEDLESETCPGSGVQGEAEAEAGTDDGLASMASLAQFMESDAMGSPKSVDFGRKNTGNGIKRRSKLNKKQSVWNLRDVSLAVQVLDSSPDGEPVTDLADIEDASVDEVAPENESIGLDDHEDLNLLTPPLRSPIARPQGLTPSRMRNIDADADSAASVLFDSDNEDDIVRTSPLTEGFDVFSSTVHATGAHPEDDDVDSARPVGADGLADKEAIVTNAPSDNAEVLVMVDKAFGLSTPDLALLPTSTPLFASEGNKGSNREASRNVVLLDLGWNGKSAQQDTESSSSSQNSSSATSPQLVAGSATSQGSTATASPKGFSLPTLLDALTLASPTLKATTVNSETLAGDLIVYSSQVPSTPPNMSTSPLALSSHSQSFFANFSAWHLPALAQVSGSTAPATFDFEATNHEYTPTSVHNRFEDVSVGLVSSGTPTIEESPVTEEGLRAEVNTATPAASRENLCHGMTSGEESRIQTLTPVSTPTPATRLLSAIKTRDEQRNGVASDVDKSPSKTAKEPQAQSDATTTIDPTDMSFREALDITPPKSTTHRGRTTTTTTIGSNNYTSRRDIDPSPTRARPRRPFIPTLPSVTTSTRATAGGSPAPVNLTPTTANGIISRLRHTGRRRFSSAGNSLHGVRTSASWRVRTEISGGGAGEREQNKEEQQQTGLVKKVWREVKGFLGREMNVLRY